jgi:two-component system OmpR family sensor kinase
MSRVPIRLRLALFFAAAAAVLLTAVAGFGYVRLSDGLSQDLDRELRQRAQDLIVPVSRPGTSLEDLAGTGFIERGESFAEVVSPSGHLLQATSTLHGRPLLSPAEAARAGDGTITLDRSSAPGLDEPARLLATPFTRDGRRVVLVVGDTRENGLETLRRVRAQLLVGIPLLVLLTFLGAYAVAGAALRPVEAMRRRASELTAGDPGLRLPIPAAADEIARLGVTLNELLARVERTLDRERAFVAHASHELRTPLALLRTQLELAVRRPRSASELADAIRSAEVEVDRLQRLAEDLLLLAQAAEGQLAVHLEDVTVAEVFADVRSRFAAAFSETGRTLEIAGLEGVVRVDRSQLHQALTNLVGNALQHGGRVVRLDARSQDGQLELVVGDQGDGFAAEMLEHGMERFVRDRASSGAGLGLAIIATIAAANGGVAGVRNVEGGAEAWITVPVSAARTGAAPPTARPAPLLAPPLRPSASGSARSRASVRRAADRAGRSRR